MVAAAVLASARPGSAQLPIRTLGSRPGTAIDVPADQGELDDPIRVRVRVAAVRGDLLETVAGTGLRGYAGDERPATDARLLFPLGLLVVASDQVAFTERESFIVRGLGTIPAEFKVRAPLPPGVPRARIACADGDVRCDADDVPGRCTFRIAVCLNNEDHGLACVPDAITSLPLRVGRRMASVGRRSSAPSAVSARPSDRQRAGRRVPERAR